MSWKSIAGNQTVSRANLQNAIDTGVFIQKNGVPGTETNRQITKANAQDYIYTWDLYPPFLSKASNQLPVKSNLAVQSNQVYGAGGENTSQILIGNTNRSWVYSIDSPSGDRIGSVASSTDNRCILYGKSYDAGAGGGGAHVSNDYGETFRRLDEVMSTNDAALGTAMSSNGELMILTRQVGSFDADRAKIYRSNDAGVSWIVGYEDGVRYNFNGAAMSGVGNYATVLGSDGTNYYVFTSNTFGASYTRTNLCQGIKTLITGCVGMSKSGQYQLLTPPEPTGSSIGYFYVSNNYGSSWTAVTVVDIPLAPNDIFKGCSVSAGGDYMTVVAYSTTLTQFRTYISSDFGVSWTVISGGSNAQAVDSSGQFQYQKGRESIDYGNTWTNVFISSAANSISVNPTTFTTPYIYGTSTGGNLFKSVDQGVSFSALSISGYFTKVATSGGSNNGKYVAAIRDNDPGGFPSYNLYQSSNYGATWSTSLFFGGQVLSCCAVSDDGVYWLAAAYDEFYTYIYRSTDSGASFQYVTQATFFAQDCAISNDGKYMTIIITRASGSGTILNSTNYGASWTGASIGFFGNGAAYIAMSGQGRYRSFATSTNEGGRIYYSGDYGVTFAEDLYIADFFATSCALDDSGRVGVASFAGGAIPLATTSRIFSTTDGWNSYNTFQPTVPVPLAPPSISGVNVSSDGTYWSAVTSNVGYSYTCKDGDGIFIARGSNNNPTFNSLSK
jgi:hypothetical protein